MIWKKNNFQIHYLKNVSRQLLFLEIVSVMKIKNKLLICNEYKVVGRSIYLLHNNLLQVYQLTQLIKQDRL